MFRKPQIERNYLAQIDTPDFMDLIPFVAGSDRQAMRIARSLLRGAMDKLGATEATLTVIATGEAR